jgi:NADH dehydrogenase FAD-containing subunit
MPFPSAVASSVSSSWCLPPLACLIVCSENFEAAALPTTSPEERKRLLSFVVCGGGPTGVEAAAEIYDLCQEDIMDYYPKLCREEVSIHVIQSREHILNTYSEAISKYAEVRQMAIDCKIEILI